MNSTTSDDYQRALLAHPAFSDPLLGDVQEQLAKQALWRQEHDPNRPLRTDYPIQNWAMVYSPDLHKMQPVSSSLFAAIKEEDEFNAEALLRFSEETAPAAGGSENKSINYTSNHQQRATGQPQSPSSSTDGE